MAAVNENNLGCGKTKSMTDDDNGTNAYGTCFFRVMKQSIPHTTLLRVMKQSIPKNALKDQGSWKKLAP